MITLSSRDLQRLAGVHPMLIAHLDAIFDEMSAEPAPMFVVVGVRTAEQQAADYAKGRTATGPIVTMCDGVTTRSAHQVRADGFGHAVDCAFVSLQPFDPRHPWKLFGEKLEARGLIWGGRFSHPVDLDHAEMPEATGTVSA